MDKPAVRNRSAAIKKSAKGKKSPGKFGKKTNGFPSKGKKIDNRMKKLFRKRARDYNSDDDDDLEAENEQARPKKKFEAKPRRNDNLEGKLHNKGHFEGKLHDKGHFEGKLHNKENFEGKLRKNEGDDVEALGQGQASDDEDIEIQPGITKFAEGCRAFRMAFQKIMKKNLDEELGPVLSAHKKLVLTKLAEEESEKKVKSEAKKEKQLVAEKGHVKPANFLDSHEKFLIGVATKGVVKLFNAVNKAQNAQKGLDPSRTKDAKVLRQRRKQVFFSELSKASGQSNDAATAKASEREQPSWGPLRDTYMLTAPKLKDWDKTADTTTTDDVGVFSEDSSDDE